jgi:ABC-type multidrug transport system ATPase subunit
MTFRVQLPNWGSSFWAGSALPALSATMPEFAIVTHGLTKRYGNVTAVDAIDLRVAQGEVYGYLGLNGASKSTTIRMLLGMVTPTSGSVEVFGTQLRSDARTLWRRVGHLVESATAARWSG